MSAAPYNIVMNQGEDFELQLNIKDSSGVLVNLTGYTYAGQIREKYDSSSIVASFTYTLANQTTNPGVVFIRISHTNTSLIPCLPATPSNRRPITEFIYDLEETKPDSTVTRILEGVVSVSPEVTK